jgi:hypothetical protein
MLAALLRVQHTTDGSSNSSRVPPPLQGTLKIDDHTFNFAVIS